MIVNDKPFREEEPKKKDGSQMDPGASDLFETNGGPEVGSSDPALPKPKPANGAQENSALDAKGGPDRNAADLDVDGAGTEDDELPMVPVHSRSTRDLLMVNLEVLRKAKLKEGWYDGGELHKIEPEVKQGPSGPWVRLKFVAKVVHDGQTYYPYYMCSNALKSGSRLYTLLEGLMGIVPANIRLDALEGMKVRVKIVHESDKFGNVWENIGALQQM